MATSADMPPIQAGRRHVRYSAVMADHPRFAQQALTLVWTLIDCAGVAPGDILVHVLDGSPAAGRRQIEALGIATVPCAPFREGHPHCNKLRQLEHHDLVSSDVVVLCDTDLAFAGPITEALPAHAVRAKIVDLPNPPIDVWQRILADAGLPEPALAPSSFGEHTTPSFNCNGGLYLLPGPAARLLAAEWPRWATWLIDRPHLVPEPFRVHIDQVAFGLAMSASRLPLELLPLEWNYPTHDAVHPKQDLAPHVLHYHDHVDASGLLKRVGLPKVDEAIDRVNSVIRARRRTHFENPSFWDFRYAHDPGLGSGVGSRGEHLTYKRELLARVVAPHQSVLDVGCGDLEVTRTLPVAVYTGVDISAGAIALAREKRPDWTFVTGDLGSLDLPPHDVVVCFDVLIHQRTMAAYRALVSSLVGLTQETLIVGAYDAEPTLTSEITFSHEPISRSIERLVGAGNLLRIGGYRDATVVRADLAHASPSSLVELLRQVRVHETPLGRFAAVPGDLIATQFDTYGGHTRNELAMVMSMLDPGDVVVDVGAHIGSFAVPIARHVGPQGRVLAIEPDAGNVELLYRNLVLNHVADRVVVVETVAAAGGITVRAERLPGNTGALHFLPDRAGARETGSVDDLCREHLGGVAPRLIKVDVEGMELSVLQSAAETIARARPLVYCEVVDAQLVRQGSSVAALDTFFKQHGYVLFRNVGERNSTHDRFEIAALTSLAGGGPFFDCLAVPAEAVDALVARGRLPATTTSRI